MTYQPFCGCLVVVCLDIFLRVELMVVKEGVVHLFNRICSSDAGTGGGRVNPIPTKGGGAYSANSLLPASPNRIHLVNLEKEKCKID